MAQLASIFDQQASGNGRHSKATTSSHPSNPNPQIIDPRTALRQQNKQFHSSSSRSSNLKEIDPNQLETQLSAPISVADQQEEEEEDDEEEEEDGDASSELSTTSGRRHGQLLQPEIEDWAILESPYMTHWNHKRHLTGGNPKPRDARDLPDWRMRERLRTVTAALVMCLNIGVDPPDVSKTNPCSKLICWMDPGSLEVSKALPAIGKNLQAQFETLSMKTRYKQYLDPIVEETKRFCTSLRRTAKDERVLFYYNGFGVPKPTPGGEIWVFNKAYTQYIPVTLYDLQNWLGNPCIFVWDASAAGNVVVNFKRLAERKAEEEAKQKENSKDKDKDKDGKEKSKENPSSSKSKPSNPSSEEPHFPLRESIHLAACAPDEVLPMNPDLPADLFTCCLTSPIEISLRWFVLQNPLPSSLNVDMVMSIPGRLQDRRTPLGELNWIFTAITDTIAWTVLPRIIFRRLFRDDLMVAALLRNFLLAERIMRFYHCTPMSHPKLPPTHNHPLWDSWDLAVDQCLAQLPTLLAKEKAQQEAANGGPPVPPHLASFEYRHSTFFSEQLKAFEVWLSQGGVSRKGTRRKVIKAASIHRGLSGTGSGGGSAATSDDEEEETSEPIMARDPPDQLPIVLQVLLSQVHRLRALVLLSQFLDLGPWAVNLALSIGIFPYVLKLLQSPAADLKPVLIYIWARILAVDRSCQNDLLRDHGFTYFAGVLSPFHPTTAGGGSGPDGRLPIPNVSEHRAMCAFILSVFCQDFPAGQQACLETDTIDSCLEHLEDDDFLLRQWSALCLAQLWDDKEEAKVKAISKDAHGKLCCMMSDVSPEVRAAVLYALGTLLGTSGSSFDPNDPISSTLKSPPTRRCLGTGSSTGMPDHKVRNLEVGISVAMLATKSDCSPMVRKELVIALSPVVRENLGFFVLAAYLYYHREEVKMRERDGRGAKTSNESSNLSSEESIEADTEALLARVLSKLVIEEDLHEIDIANIPAFTTIFVAILDLSVDSYPEVSSLASTVLDFIIALMVESEVSRASESIMRRFGAIDATNRLVTPTNTRHVPDGYFPPTPRVTSPALEDGMSDLGIHQNGHLHQTSNASALGHGNRPNHQPRRSASLAQTVKAIATLGYSRQSSPTGSASEHEGANVASSTGGDRSPYSTNLGFPSGGRGKNGAPAPHFNVAHYISPYTYTGLNSPEGMGNTASSASTPASPTNKHASLAHRSASAESLAQIANRQRKSASNSTMGTAATPTTPGAPPTSYSSSSPSSGDAAHHSKVDEVKVGDALASLIAVDLQRFRNRAQIAADGGLPPPGSSTLNTPISSPSNKLPKDNATSAASSSIREVLPLKSRLFSWCSEYYTEPQMKNAEADEAGSISFNIQTWKRQRNEKLVNDAQNQTEYASKHNWNQNAGLLAVGSSPSLMLFHQFEDQLVTASDQDIISVWDWKQQKLISRFHNGNPPRTKITSSLFVNEDVDALLLVGSEEGNIRLYRHYDRPSWSSKGPELASTFRALPDLVRSKRPSGLIADWQQVTGHILAGGDSHVIRVWDAHRELCVCDIPTRASSCVTSISSEIEIGHIFIAGFGDGTVGVYDRRNPPEASLVRLWEEHQTWIQKVHLQRRGNRELMSASLDGEVRLWDIRGRSSISKLDLSGNLRGRLSSLAVHEHVPVFAATSTPRPTRTGTSSPQLLLNHFDSLTPIGQSPSKLRPLQTSTGVSGPGVGLPPSSESHSSTGAAAFHPHLPLLAFAGHDSIVELKRCLPAPNTLGDFAELSLGEENLLGSHPDFNAKIPEPKNTTPSRRGSSSGWLAGWA